MPDPADAKRIHNPFFDEKQKEQLIEIHSPYYAEQGGYSHHCVYTICVTTAIYYYSAYSSFRRMIRAAISIIAGGWDKSSSSSQTNPVGNSPLVTILIAGFFVVASIVVTQGVWVFFMGLPYTYHAKPPTATPKTNGHSKRPQR
jgi:hypothetical protein